MGVQVGACVVSEGTWAGAEASTRPEVSAAQPALAAWIWEGSHFPQCPQSPWEPLAHPGPSGPTSVTRKVGPWPLPSILCILPSGCAPSAICLLQEGTQASLAPAREGMTLRILLL